MTGQFRAHFESTEGELVSLLYETLDDAQIAIARMSMHPLFLGGWITEKPGGDD